MMTCKRCKKFHLDLFADKVYELHSTFGYGNNSIVRNWQQFNNFNFSSCNFNLSKFIKRRDLQYSRPTTHRTKVTGCKGAERWKEDRRW